MQQPQPNNFHQQAGFNANVNYSTDYPDEDGSEKKKSTSNAMFGFMKKVASSTSKMTKKAMNQVKKSMKNNKKKTPQNQQMTQPQQQQNFQMGQPQQFNPQPNFGNQQQMGQPQQFNPHMNFQPQQNNSILFQGNYYPRNTLKHHKIYKPLSHDLDTKKALNAAEVVSTASGHDTIGAGFGQVNNSLNKNQPQGQAQIKKNNNSDPLESVKTMFKVGKGMLTLGKFATAVKSKVNTVKNDFLKNPFLIVNDSDISKIQGRNEIEKIENLRRMLQSKKRYLSRKQCLYIFTSLTFEDSKLYFANCMGPLVHSVDVDVIGLMCNETYFCKVNLIRGFWRFLDKETEPELVWKLLDLVKDKRKKEALRKEMGLKKRDLLETVGLGGLKMFKKFL